MPIQIQRVHRQNANLPFDAEERQRKLDDQLVKVNFDDITVTELKELLRQRGKSATGKKAVLLQRLQDEQDFIKAIRSGQHPSSIPNASTAAAQAQQQQAILAAQHQQHQQHQQQQQQQQTQQQPSYPTPAPPSPGASSSSSLYRSIAEMHIGSPPAQHIRRYAPYGPPQPASPRMTTAQFSSSVPTGFMYSSTNANVNAAPDRRLHKYAPFMPSALATPDREEDQDPFDQLLSQMEPMEIPSGANGDAYAQNAFIESILNGNSDDMVLDSPHTYTAGPPNGMLNGNNPW
jgi:hypothetical protein